MPNWSEVKCVICGKPAGIANADVQNLCLVVHSNCGWVIPRTKSARICIACKVEPVVEQDSEVCTKCQQSL